MSPSSVHSSKIHRSLEAGEAAKSDVAASWQRCLTRYRLHPDIEPPQEVLTRHELKLRLARMEVPIRMAQPELNGLGRSMANLGGALSLTDGDGATLMSWPSRTGPLASRKFQPGTLWREAVQGTNGVGTCLENGRPVSISLDRHFFSSNAGFICITTPIFAPDGGISGTLNVSFANSSIQSILSILLKSLVDTAQKFEMAWFRANYADCMIVSVADAPSAGGSIPLAAVTSDLRLVGATHALRRHHKIGRGDIKLGVPFSRIQPQLVSEAFSLKDAEFDVLTRAVNKFNGRVDEAAAHLGLSRATMYRKLKAVSRD